MPAKRTLRLFIFIFLVIFFINENLFAAIPGLPNLPGSVEPGRVGQDLTSPRDTTATPGQPLPMESMLKEQSSLGPEAAKIRFKLTNIMLSGNTVYSDETLSALYQDKINKEISVLDLENIVQAITNFYRNNGYILSRAVLPPQHIQHGVVEVRVVEGYIGNVNVVGAKRAQKLIRGYASHIQESRPLQLSVLEHYLFLTNEIPGVKAQVVLEPSKTLTNSVSDLNLVANQQIYTGYLSYDNFQSRYNGPLETTGNLNGNSILLPGDSTHLTYLVASTPSELNFFDLSYEAPIGTKGWRGQLGGNNSVTRPAFVLTPLDLKGTSEIYYGNLFYPLIRSRTQNLTLDGGFIYFDSRETFLGNFLYADHIRTLGAGGIYDFSDRFLGVNTITAHLVQGLPLFGATNNTHSLQTSRFGGTGVFTKILGQLSRTQTLVGPFSLYGTALFQKSFQPLLAYEQFGFGGPYVGRGYDPSELLGDQGVSGSFEFRGTLTPGWRLLQSYQGFVFYDIGKIWNLKNVPGVKSNQSASSAGGGFRLYFTSTLSGTWTIAQPLTRQESTLAFIGRGRAPRTLFSVTASFF